MRALILFIVLSISFVAVSQDTINNNPVNKKRKIQRHQIELSPASVWLNKGFFYGHRLKYQVQIKKGMRIELESNGTLFRVLDDRASEPKGDKVFSLLNQSTAVYKMNLIGRGKTVNRNKQKRFIGSLRLGYHFFQHSTPYWDFEYWAYDSTVQTGLNSIRSFQSHSVTTGLDFRVDKYKRKDGGMMQVASHKWSLDYLGSVFYQLSSYSINDSNEYNIKNIPNPHALRKSGGRLTYGFTRYLNSYFGIHFGMEAVYVPFLKDYTFDSDYYVLRGSERLLPLFTNVHVGVSFVF